MQTDTVTFIDDRYYTSSTGQHWPRVTTILEAFPKGEGFYSWMKSTGKNADDILQSAGETGTRVHQATQDYDSGRSLEWVTRQWSKEEWALLCRYAEFCSYCNPEILLQEVSFVSDTLQYGGTIDRVVMIDGMRLLIDIKTSNYIYKQHWCQVAAYSELYRELDPHNALDGVGILHLKAKTRKEMKSKDGYQGKGWSLDIRTMYAAGDDFKAFQKTYELWRYDNDDYQPGVKTYPAVLKRNNINL